MVRMKFEMHLAEASKEHEALMLKTYAKNNEVIKRLENELSEFRVKTSEELARMMTLLKSQRNSYADYNIDEEMPNPFSEILKQQ